LSQGNQERLSVTAAAMTKRLDPQTAERRRHARVKVCLTGQFMRESRQEFPCVTIDISPGGIAFAADAAVFLGEKIIAYIAQIGRVQGNVRRQFPGGFAVAMTLPALKREKLADQLTWLANRHELGVVEDRRHERIVPRNRNTTLLLPNGREILCRIIDISRSGVALTVETRLPVGALVTIGQTRGQIVREFAGGFAVEFTRIIPDDQFDDAYEP
jgi:hypothetical protein